jgi:cbb3-type cytochrome oxidase maturation protein
MSVILVLIFFSLLVACAFLAAFLWAVRTGQYDDQFTPSVRILFENEKTKEKKTIINIQETNN